jgi:N-acetylglucosaminyl-diphospho-decaprenol L-rhamnosyltransferase
MPAERVGVVVVTFNSADVLPGLLESLPAGLSGLDWRLVAVDNLSRDGSPDVVARLAPDAQHVPMGRNAGYAAGINAGVVAAGDVTAVLVLNPDVRLGQGCVPELLRALRIPGTGIAVPRLADGLGRLNQSMRREPTVRGEFLETIVGAQRLGRVWDVGQLVADPAKYTEERTTDWAEGSTQLISRECLDVCGPWDESFFLFSEETEFGLRARDRGYATRFVPTATATHLEGGSVDDPAKWALLCRNKIDLFRRRNGPVRSALFHLCAIAREASRAATGRATSRAALRVLLSKQRLSAPAGPEWLHELSGRASAQPLDHTLS